MSAEDTFRTPELAYSISEGKCVLFVGSGLSKHTRDLPTWSDFISRIWGNLSRFHSATSDLIEDNIKAYPLEYLEFAKSNYGAQYYRHLERELKVMDAGPTPDVYKTIASLPWAAIITTNLDTLLEDAFEEQGVKTIVVDSEDDLSNIGVQDGILILKMHGSISNHHSQVLTRFEYLDFDFKRHGMKAIVLSLFTQFPTLIVGAGLTDPNFLKIYGIAHEVMGHMKHRAFYVGYGVPKFVRRIWRDRKFEFVKVAHEELTNWFKALKRKVDDVIDQKSYNKPPAFLNLYLKEAAMLNLGDVLHDYRAIQQRYLDQVHIPDYGWFSKSWDYSLYGRLRPKLLEILMNMNKKKLGLLYVAPGPHAPLFSDEDLNREFKKIISAIDVVDILPSVVFTAASNLRRQLDDENISIDSLISDLTGGCGDAFCNVFYNLLNETDDLKIIDKRIAKYEELVNLILPHEKVQDVALSVISAIKTSKPSCEYDIIYSEMVASFMGTAPMIGFRSALFKKFGASHPELAVDVVGKAEVIWKRFNDEVFDLHIRILSGLLRQDGILVVATDTEKIFDDNRINVSCSFSSNADPVISNASVKREGRFETNFLWRDHSVAFDVKIAGVLVNDFLKHQHRVQIYVYKKL